jgi:hypothetical protein
LRAPWFLLSLPSWTHGAGDGSVFPQMRAAFLRMLQRCSSLGHIWQMYIHCGRGGDSQHGTIYVSCYTFDILLTIRPTSYFRVFPSPYFFFIFFHVFPSPYFFFIFMSPPAPQLSVSYLSSLSHFASSLSTNLHFLFGKTLPNVLFFFCLSNHTGGEIQIFQHNLW